MMILWSVSKFDKNFLHYKWRNSASITKIFYTFQDSLVFLVTAGKLKSNIAYFQVKIEVFTSALPVAFAVFNASGLDKMNWMSADHLITSSWNDIKAYMANKPVNIAIVGRYMYITDKQVSEKKWMSLAQNQKRNFANTNACI